MPKVIDKIIEETVEKLADRPKLQLLFKNCFPNTLETTTKVLDDGSTFVFTGDIPAMWLRDSVEQVIHYVPYISEDAELQALIKGLITRHIFYINHDPYTNAFNETANDAHWNKEDKSFLTPWIWERKYELDSLCFSLKLIYQYWKVSNDNTIFDDAFYRMLESVLTVWETEQYHFEKSDYTFEREDCPDIDTLKNKGRGMPVNYTGMTWSGFRPSDDACDFGYHIPSNMFAVVVLDYMTEILEAEQVESVLLARVKQLRAEIDYGIQTYGTYLHPTYGRIYAYETDGYGNHALLDDAGTPSLLSIPYLGYRSSEDAIYKNTRSFALSKDNPYYFEGEFAKGLGSPHTPDDYVWHLGLSMQALTTNNPTEIAEVLQTLENTDGDKGFMHEGFHVDDPTIFTRDWFAWSNSMFSQVVLHALKKKAI